MASNLQRPLVNSVHCPTLTSWSQIEEADVVLATRRKRTGKDVSTDKVSGELRCVLRDEEEVTRGATTHRLPEVVTDYRYARGVTDSEATIVCSSATRLIL